MGNMPLGKAAELLQAIVQTGTYEGDPDDSDAIKLGREALLAILRSTNTTIQARHLILKGSKSSDAGYQA